MRRLASVVLALLVSACGGDDPVGPGSLDGSMTALVDGVQWAASFEPVGQRNANDIIGMAGVAANGSTISFAFPATGPGTYTLPLLGMNCNYGASGQVWQALGMGDLGSVGSCSVTVNSLSSQRITGTFAFTAPAAAGSGATGQRVVTAGTFDVRLP